jgi:hypothetical protein
MRERGTAYSILSLPGLQCIVIFFKPAISYQNKCRCSDIR